MKELTSFHVRGENITVMVSCKVITCAGTLIKQYKNHRIKTGTYNSIDSFAHHDFRQIDRCSNHAMFSMTASGYNGY